MSLALKASRKCVSFQSFDKFSLTTEISVTFCADWTAKIINFCEEMAQFAEKFLLQLGLLNRGDFTSKEK